MQDRFSHRRLERASKHVASLWFPINRDVLVMIRKKIQEGNYAEHHDLIFEDLKQDFALFTFVVKELLAMASEQNVDPHVVSNPVELIRWAGPEGIRKLIGDDARLPMNHLLHSSSTLQVSRLRETAIAASTAEVLSGQKNLDPDTGFSRGIIRETGLNLIAWNYPSLYSRVVKNLVKGQSLDEQLSQELGFSPVTLAMRVLQPASLSGADESNFFQGAAWESYDRLCEIGAALARADSPETYPSAENDWKLANDYLQKTLGNEGITLIKHKAEKCSEDYKQSLSGLFKSTNDLNPEKHLQSHKKQSTWRRNRYIERCPTEIQGALQLLYSHLADATSTGAALELLIRKIIPDAGFTGGCVYLVEPASLALMPRTVFGTVKLRAIERVMLKQSIAGLQPHALSGVSGMGSSEPDLAATALSCAQPVIERRDGMLSEGLTGMYASLGDAKKVGVLYLEVPEAADTDEGQQTMSTFKAMRQALADTLKLE